MEKWTPAYLISSDKMNAIKLSTEYSKKCLVYRVSKTIKRLSYKKLKKHLVFILCLFQCYKTNNHFKEVTFYHCILYVNRFTFFTIFTITKTHQNGK